MACAERRARLRDEECIRTWMQEGRDSLKEALDQLHAATQRVGAVHERFGALAEEAPREAQKHPEGVPARGVADTVKADLDAHVRQLELMQSQHDSAFRAALERWSESSESPDSSGDTWRSIEERVGQLHAEHLRQVRTLYSTQAQRLVQLLPALSSTDSTADWEPLEESPQIGFCEPQTNETESITSSTNGGGSSRKSMRLSVKSWLQRRLGGSHVSGVSETDSVNFTASGATGSRSMARISSISGVASLALRHDSCNVAQAMTSSRTTAQAKGMYRHKKSSSHPRLEAFSGALILLNIVWMAIDVDLGMRSVSGGEATPEWIPVGDIIFAILFAIELVARLVLSGREFFDSKQLPWNMLAVFVTCVDITDIAVRLDSSSFLKSLRVLRLVRTLRLLRAIRNVRHLRVMAASILCSLPSLSWALVLLGMLMFVVALFLMQTLETHFRMNPDEKPDPKIMKHFGSLPLSMLSILMAITGGVDWQDILQVLEPISPIYAPIFSLFIAFVTVGVLNILTAVFVQSIHKISEVDSDLAIIEQIDEDSHQYHKMHEFFREADFDDDGYLSKADFDHKLEEPSCQAQMRTLDLNVWSVRGLFHLLCFQEGSVEIEELVYGLMRLKGSAKAVDMAILLYESKRSQGNLAKVSAAADNISDRLDFLESHLRGSDGSPSAGPREPARASRAHSARTTRPTSSPETIGRRHHSSMI